MEDRYKVGAGTNWNDTASWSTSSGGASGASFPVAGDNVFLDANSNNLTVNVNSACANFTATGYTGTLSSAANLTVSGTFTWPASGATSNFGNTLVAASDGVPGSRSWTLNSFAATATVDVQGTAAGNGPSLTGTVSILILTLTQGTLSVASSAVLTVGNFASSNTNTRTITLTSGASVTLIGDDDVWDCSTSTNLTVTATGSTITFNNGSGAAQNFLGGGKTYGNIAISGIGDPITFTGANTYAAMTQNISGTVVFNGDQVVTDTLTLTAGILIVTGSLSVGSFSSSGTGVREFSFEDQTITLTGTGTVWDVSTPTNLTLTTSSASTIVISDTSSTGKTFAGGGLTYSVILTITGSAGFVTFTGNNTFSLAFTSGASRLVFTGTTTTFSDDVTLTGLISLTGGTWSKTAGTVTAGSGSVIANNTASGGATFDGSSAYDGHGNSGWFGLIPFPKTVFRARVSDFYISLDPVDDPVLDLVGMNYSVAAGGLGPNIGPPTPVPGVPSFAKTIPYNQAALTPDRKHQQATADLLNGLLRTGEIKFDDVKEWVLGYAPEEIQDWGPGQPVTIAEALNRIAAALKNLGSPP